MLDGKPAKAVKRITGLVTVYEPGDDLVARLDSDGLTCTVERSNGYGCIVSVPRGHVEFLGGVA